MDSPWILESVNANGTRTEHAVSHWPFRVGRDADNDLTVASPSLSRHHATLTGDISGQLRITDLNSTNGSFVNRTRVEGSCLLKDGDIVHFGTAEFRLRHRTAQIAAKQVASEQRTMLIPMDTALSEHFIPNETEFLQLLDGHGMSGAAQPIVLADGYEVFAYELLGRANHPLLPASPLRLFELAGALGRETELSAAFRKFGIARASARLPGLPLFANTHPKETFSKAFFDSLIKLRQELPDLDLIIEIHETAVTVPEHLRELTARLLDIGVRFAYDDFGAGQARLVELSEAPAHFVKFDMGLIHDIDCASERKRRVVGDLVKLVLDLGSAPLAEGVEREEEAAACRDLGFQLIQGYHTGKPVAIDKL
ncbi:EAL domain-containing protein [Viridibacterium curvum]|uniref:EAL domain-containing protein n=1 Tax=Viridibacterium curvum TaxID=1101404 RepID=A0ABP9QU77_9RHOO